MASPKVFAVSKQPPVAFVAKTKLTPRDTTLITQLSLTSANRASISTITQNV
jgi:hypothetical protein